MKFEQEYFLQSQQGLIGIDEAGRGALFGPVTVAAVAVSRNQWQQLETQDWFSQIRDSKKISSNKRQLLFEKISYHLPHAIAHVSVGFIEKYNINVAVQYGLYRSVFKLQNKNSLNISHFRLLMDGNYNFIFPHLRMKQNFFPVQYLVKGDDHSFAIACASILAKVSRDRLMVLADKRFPQYSLSQHKGYGTKIHRQALQDFGTSFFHRKHFLKKFL